jgi:hypothetical protein
VKTEADDDHHLASWRVLEAKEYIVGGDIRLDARLMVERQWEWPVRKEVGGLCKCLDLVQDHFLRVEVQLAKRLPRAAASVDRVAHVESPRD